MGDVSKTYLEPVASEGAETVEPRSPLAPGTVADLQAAAGSGDLSPAALVEALNQPVVPDVLSVGTSPNAVSPGDSPHTPEGRHLHKPDLTSIRVEERHVHGTREIRPPCVECGEMMSWKAT